MSELSRELADYYARFGRHLRPYLLSMEPNTHQSRAKPHKLNIPSTSKYTTTSPKSKESSSGRISENADDDHHADYSLNKDCSPESSFTSRKLEWDSLADIGYNNSENVPNLANNSLSTLERIALERHYKIAFSHDSAKNKATIGIKTKNSLIMGQPKAHSTPNESNPKPPIPKVNVSDETTKDDNAENPQPESERIIPTVDIDKTEQDVQFFNKEIQTSLVQNICTSSQTSQRLTEQSGNVSNILTKGPVIFNVVKSKKNSKSSIRHRQPRVVKIYSTTKQIESSEKTSIISSDKSSIISSNISKCDDDMISKADSFEFVPGYMFNKSSDSDKSNKLHSYVESSMIPSSRSNQISIDSGNDFTPKFKVTTSFSNDLLTNINMANELIDQKPEDPDFKKNIVTKMVNSMIDANYKNDTNSGSGTIDKKRTFDKGKSSIALINELVNSRHSDPVVKERLIKKMVKLLIDADCSDDEKIIVTEPKITYDEYCQTESHRSDKSKRNSSKDTPTESSKKSTISSTPRDHTISSTSNNTLIKLLDSDKLATQRKIDIINDEIVNLYKMKLNLENKGDGKKLIDDSRQKAEDLSENIYVPPLDLESSPDESQEKSLPVEMSSKSSTLRTTNREKLKKGVNTFENSVKSVSKASSKIDTSAESKLSKSCICSLRSSNLCQYCSKTNSTDSNSITSKSTSEELRKMCRTYSKYEKCKTMKSFVKEYEALVTKYKNMKTLLASKQQNIEKSDDIRLHSSTIDSKSEEMNFSRNDNSNYISPNMPNMTKSTSCNSAKDPASQSESILEFQSSTKSSGNKSINHEIFKQMANTMKHIESYLSSMNKNTKSPADENINLIDESKSNRSRTESAKCACKSKPDAHQSASSNQAQRTYRKCQCTATKPCKPCLKKSLQSQIKQLGTDTYEKPIAYDLILQPSDSILDESYHKSKRKPLDQVIVKVPSLKNNHVKKNDNRALLNPSIVISPCDGSTDDQLKEFSSLNDDNSSIGEAPVNIKCTKTLYDYLMENRPRFIRRADDRRRIIQQFAKLRCHRDEERRKLIATGISKKNNLKDISLSDIQIKPKTYLTANQRLFDYRDIVMNTKRQCKNLSEVQMKKEILRKNEFKKTNRVMAEIFVKQLRRKAIKGVVNFSHNSNIISL